MIILPRSQLNHVPFATPRTPKPRPEPPNPLRPPLLPTTVVSSVETIRKPTNHGTAIQRSRSTGNLAFSSAHHRISSALTRPEHATAFGLTDPKAAQNYTADKAATPAASVELPPTTHNSAPQYSPELCCVVTSLNADAWEALLGDLGLLEEFSDIPFGIRNGFNMGVTSPPSSTYTPPNHTSALDHPEAVMSHINKELSAGRYTGPFSRDRLEMLIGPFRSSPLGVVPKAGTNEFRLVQDFSYPRDDPDRASVNSEINMDNFNCDWGTFQQVVEIILDSPTNAEAATLDVDSAFRQCPILPSQQPNFIVMWNDLYYIDHNAPFGAATSGFVFGRIADALMAIFRKLGIGPAQNWVDDFLIFRFPRRQDSPTEPQFSYDLDTIFEITTKLGWPWKPSKTRPFHPNFKYLGFVWDIINKTVKIPPEKKDCYLTKLKTWSSNRTISRREAESLLGTLVHCSLVIPEGRSRLPALARFASSFNHLKPYVRKAPSSGVTNDLKWWTSQLNRDFCGMVLQGPPPPDPIEFWVDASTDWGIGVIFGRGWESWKLNTHWRANGRNIGWAEFIAIEIGLLIAVSKGFKDTHFVVHSDNQGVIYSILNGKSRSPEQNIVLQRISALLAIHNLYISPTYVPSSSNRADNPSRGFPVPLLPRESFNIPLPDPLKPLLQCNPHLRT